MSDHRIYCSRSIIIRRKREKELKRREGSAMKAFDVMNTPLWKGTQVQFELPIKNLAGHAGDMAVLPGNEKKYTEGSTLRKPPRELRRKK